MLHLRLGLALLLAITMLLPACNRGGHSRKFRNAAEEALKSLRAANNTESASALEQAEAAIAEAKSKITTNQDLHTADVLAWYATLLHRRDRRRTENWRAICDAEVQMLLDAAPTGRARIRGSSAAVPEAGPASPAVAPPSRLQATSQGHTEVPVNRGDCQAAFFQMLAEDCAAHADPASCNPPAAGR
ncbi:MAG: hypothetical protein ACE14L_03015 [Terriglobales bacterium]